MLGVQELETLATWLYLEPGVGKRKMKCSRAHETHLIGRDLMYALCHAEYLVFMGQGKLSAALQGKIGMLRLMVSYFLFSSSDQNLRLEDHHREEPEGAQC